MKPLPSLILAANVSCVPQRSPLRYPGGKTWLIPHIRAWLSGGDPASVLLDPFTGGGTASLTAVMEGLASRSIMVDLDRDVSAFWRAAILHTDELIDRVQQFQPTRESIESLSGAPSGVVEHGFRTLVLNRVRRGGVIGPGASLLKVGENGRGLLSRWYPSTLAQRLQVIGEHADQLAFYEGDGVGIVEMLCSTAGVRIFIDPPYTTAGGKQAGLRLYAHNGVDQGRIFSALRSSTTDFLMTCDNSEEVLSLAHACDFAIASVSMKTSHHSRADELIVTREPIFT